MNVASRMIVVVVDHPTSQRTSDQGHVDEQEKETTTTTTTINDETCDESEVIFLVACDTHTHLVATTTANVESKRCSTTMITDQVGKEVSPRNKYTQVWLAILRYSRTNGPGTMRNPATISLDKRQVDRDHPLSGLIDVQDRLAIICYMDHQPAPSDQRQVQRSTPEYCWITVLGLRRPSR
jgi:hypothetical protein